MRRATLIPYDEYSYRDYYFSTNLYGENEFLLKAITEGTFDEVDYAIEDPEININYTNKDGDTAVILAVAYFRPDILEFLLISRPDIDINHIDKEGDTALSLAVKLNRPEAVKILLDNRNDVNVYHVDADGVSIIETAERYGNSEILNLLDNYMLMSSR